MPDSRETLIQGILALMPDLLVTESRLPLSVEAQLDAVGASLGGRDVLLLPTKSRGDEIWYGADDFDAVADARELGIHAAFLVDAKTRRFLGEHSAVVYLVDIGIAVAGTLTVDSLELLIKYCWGRVRRRAAESDPSADPSVTPMKLTVTRVESMGGAVRQETLALEGSTDAVLSAFRERFNLPATPRTARPPAVPDSSADGED